MQTPLDLDAPTGPMPVVDLDDEAPGADLSVPVADVPVDDPGAAAAGDLIAEDVPVEQLGGPVFGGTVFVAEPGSEPTGAAAVSVFDPPDPTSVEAAVNPPTSIHVAYTPTAAVSPVPPVSMVQAAPLGRPPSRRDRRQARRRSRFVVAGAVVAAACLVLVGVAIALTQGGGGNDDVQAAPPAAAQGQAAADDQAAPDAQGDQAAQGDAATPPAPAVDDAGVAQAQDAVAQFVAVRGTDAERAVSSQKGRAELDQVAGQLGRAVLQGDAECTAADAAGTFTCVQGTDQGDVTFTVGPDADDPATSGFEVIGASAAA